MVPQPRQLRPRPRRRLCKPADACPGWATLRDLAAFGLGQMCSNECLVLGAHKREVGQDGAPDPCSAVRWLPRRTLALEHIDGVNVLLLFLHGVTGRAQRGEVDAECPPHRLTDLAHIGHPHLLIE